MNLTEQVEKILSDKSKKNASAMAKMEAIRKEVEPLAKRTGYLESVYDGFSYYPPAPHTRNLLLFKVFVSGDMLYLVISHSKDNLTRDNVTYDPLAEILSRLSSLIATRLSSDGIYRV